MLQEPTWSFRNGSAKMRYQLEEMRDGLGKNLVFLPAVDLIDEKCEHM